MIDTLFHAVEMGFKSLMLHKLRSGLTVLGIIFGVCSVITMLAIGEGASYQAQERIKGLGSNNIIVETLKPPVEEESNGSILKYGITYLDLERILATVDGVEAAIPIRRLNEPVKFSDKESASEILGTVGALSDVKKLTISKGRFISDLDHIERRNVCVITRSLSVELFPYQEPLENSVVIKNQHYDVIGVVDQDGENADRNSVKAAYIPLNTMKSRYGNLIVKQVSGSFTAEMLELHSIVIQMKSHAAVLRGEGQIANLMKYGHKKNDYKLIVPLQLLKESEATQRMFNIVLGSIAAISLIVGGIGIMNIMLATVTERTREIGLRRALGARKSDIVSQFMIEAVILSISGGAIGVLLGLVFPKLITHWTGMEAIVSFGTVVLAFLVSALIGLIFGIYPAAKSAQLDPIEALRND